MPLWGATRNENKCARETRFRIGPNVVHLAQRLV